MMVSGWTGDNVTGRELDNWKYDKGRHFPLRCGTDKFAFRVVFLEGLEGQWP